MRPPIALYLPIALSLSLSLPASAQREAVKSKAGDASATKTDPPAHASRHADSAKKTAASQGKSVGLDGSKADGSKPDQHAEQTAYVFGLPTADGKNLPLSTYKGKVLLIVNLGRQSGFNEQMPALEKLSATFKDKGLVVIGVPSNDFGNAEPGTPAEVAKYYSDAKVDFPVMGVSSLTGVHELPLFTYLAKNKAVPDDGLHWNFTKFLVDRNGKLVARFSPEVAPDTPELTATVREVLDGTWKPKKADKGAKDGDGDGEDDDE